MLRKKKKRKVSEFKLRFLLPQVSVPTPFFGWICVCPLPLSETLGVLCCCCCCCCVLAVLFSEEAAIWRAAIFSCFSVKRFLSHRFSISSCATRASRLAFISVTSLTVRSRACSRCFFFNRNRALAAVFRRRLSSSAARRFCSSMLSAEAMRSPGGWVLYLVLPT